MAKFTSIDEYIKGFPEEVQIKLQEIRDAIKAAAPDSEEAISYNIPTFTLNGNLVHFAAFKAELAKYKHAKGSVQFPLDQKMPLSLIKKMVKFRVKENLNK